MRGYLFFSVIMHNLDANIGTSVEYYLNSRWTIRWKCRFTLDDVFFNIGGR